MGINIKDACEESFFAAVNFYEELTSRVPTLTYSEVHRAFESIWRKDRERLEALVEQDCVHRVDIEKLNEMSFSEEAMNFKEKPKDLPAPIPIQIDNQRWFHCQNRQCPEKHVRAEVAPTCYTCGANMMRIS